MKQPWYQFRNAADPAVAELHILDAIYPNDPWGEGIVTAKQFVADLGALPEGTKTIRVHINSPGGDVFTAITIANALRDQRMSKGRNVETMVDGLAASAASLILMAGAPIRMADNAMVMVHNPWGVAVGNANDMLEAAARLEQIRGPILATYKWHSDLTEEQLKALMDAETWMDAEEAVANGFADEIVPGLQASASIDPAALSRLQIPERFAARVAALATKREEPATAPAVPAQATLDEIVALCRPAGLDLEFAAGLASEQPTAAQAAQRVATERERRSAEAQRQSDIRALCDRFKVGNLAAGLIAGGTTFEAARALVAEVTGMVDRVEIDAGLAPASGKGASANADLAPQTVYANRRPKAR